MATIIFEDRGYTVMTKGGLTNQISHEKSTFRLSPELRLTRIASPDPKFINISSAKSNLRRYCACGVEGMAVLSNAKWERFAQETAKGLSGAEAYRNAGYKASGNSSAVNANRLLKSAKVRARVDELLANRDKQHAKATEKAAEALAIDREWIMAKLKENAERALQAIQAKDEDGKPLGDFKYEGAVANRALELLGKELGMFIERRESGGPGDFERLSDAELRDAVAVELAALGEAISGIEPEANQGIARGARRLN